MKKLIILASSILMIMSIFTLLGTNSQTNGLRSEVLQLKEVYTELDTALENVYQNAFVLAESDLSAAPKETLLSGEELAFVQP